ncbi:acyltransferase family protein [Propionispora vibrioides]|uniref:Peptidoglycan/LPS O-acetylase OafA/YrhL, contains acyltransferase and SGNH-hydrolase domains n=1 Tax=Propionispora vibrioides TaxID=112903 RepID=A0A1H8WU34_9FIRM|nr:acyltransferase family protein [Propionispora vibrioides]SEP31142.1 Peptidoglycan/LPS O-acetylase OafA/YrhL, contains acyltransferase and SGNH-hydrolase domains [Propionispora vibrioides]
MKLQAISRNRLYFFDNLKAFIILLMVIFHIGMGYTTWDLKWWTVNDIQKSKFFDYFILETDVYIMPIMFLAAGYFAPMVLVKKGLGAFWQDKLRRIVIPWIGGVLFIAPLIAYSTFFSRMPVPPNFFDFWSNGFWGPFYQQGHFWFLGILTLFFLLLTVFHLVKPSYLNTPRQKGMPPVWFFPFFALLTAACFFSANLFYWNDTWLNVKYIFMIQPVRLLLHLCYFSLGVYAWKQSWFTPGDYSPRLIPWSASAIIMLIVFLLYRVTFTLMPEVPLPFKIGHALTHATFAMTATFGLIAVFQNFFDSSAYLWRRLAANSYIIYFIHQCVVIPIGCLVQKLDINIWLKYTGVSIVTLLLCFLLAEYIIQPVLSLGKNKKSPPVHS